MKNYTRIIKGRNNLNFRYTKGKVDIFYSKQFHPYYEIYLFLNGKADFVNDRIRKTLDPNDLIIIPPGQYHSFIPDGKSIDTYERFVLTLNTDFLNEEILKRAFYAKEILNLPKNHRIIENFLHLKECATDLTEEDFEYILSAIATDIVFLIHRSNNLFNNENYSFLNPVSAKIMEYINKNYKTGISINEIAEELSFSVSTISHIFKKDFDVSIKKYVTEKRMNEIYTLLQKGEKPLSVADRFGFSNYSTFYRSFKTHFGLSPSRCKKLEN